MSDGMDFEEQVRQVARALWETDPGQGDADVIDGRERDSIFVLDHVTHYIECTTENTIKKVKIDAAKMVEYRAANERPGQHLVMLWIITKFAPSGHQKQLCRENGIDILSLNEFRRKVFDGTAYLELRQRCAFGSARDPENDSQDTTKIKYQPATFRSVHDGATHKLADLSTALLDGRIVVLLGDYGMGKSISIREIFQLLRKRHLKDNDGPVPVAINLREYWGRDRPAEVLARHAQDVGLEKGINLVRGFNAGRLTVMLDGFDETAAIPWGGRNLERLRDLRRSAVAVIRKFVECSRGKSGLLVAGREHFFDARPEMMTALGVRESDIIVKLDEFTEDEASSFLSTNKKTMPLPDWLPRRPLLLASFVAKGLLDDVWEQKTEVDPARAWDRLIEATCEREARIHELLDHRGIRNILENLATRTRATLSGLGPVNESDIAEAFRAETGAQPDNAAWPLLLRLPGLTARDSQPGSRQFIDDQLLSALRAGPVTQYLNSSHQPFQPQSWKHGLDDLGILVVTTQFAGRVPASKSLVMAAKTASRSGWHTLALDLIQVARNVHTEGSLDCQGLEIVDAHSPWIDFVGPAAPARLTLRECTLLRVTCGNLAASDLRLVDCIIGRIEGAGRQELLPPYVEPSCTICAFDALATNARVLNEESIDLPVRVFLTILRKLYMQGGSGRKENAFSRGMGSDANRFVSTLLEIIRRNDLATSLVLRGETIWHPVRRARARVLRMVENPTSISDPVLLEVTKVG